MSFWQRGRGVKNEQILTGHGQREKFHVLALLQSGPAGFWHHHCRTRIMAKMMHSVLICNISGKIVPKVTFCQDDNFVPWDFFVLELYYVCFSLFALLWLSWGLFYRCWRYCLSIIALNVLHEENTHLITVIVFSIQIVIIEHKSIICPGYNAVLHIHTCIEEVQIKVRHMSKRQSAHVV